MGEMQRALGTLEKALKLEPGDKELKKLQRQVRKKLRQMKNKKSPDTIEKSG